MIRLLVSKPPPYQNDNRKKILKIEESGIIYKETADIIHLKLAYCQTQRS